VSIVEALVGIAVGLLVALAAAGTVQVFSASQRQGMAVGGSAMNAATSMSMIKHDIGSAGLGFFGDGAPLCPKLNLSRGTVQLRNSSPFSPIMVTRPGGGAYDTLELAFGTQVIAGATVYTEGVSDGTNVFVKSYLPASAPEVVVLAASAAVPVCTVRSVTQVVPSTPTTPQQLVFANDGVHNSTAVAFATPAGSEDSGQVALLGNLAINNYWVDTANRTLRLTRLDGSTTVLASDVIAFRVQYGISGAPGDPTLAAWVDGATFGLPTIANLSQIRALRVGLVTRSPQREKVDSAGDCVASTNPPRVFDEVVNDPDYPTDWRCYRYRVATAVVPLRNVALGATGVK
jgi:type IV pilus assembly protein PilW